MSRTRRQVMVTVGSALAATTALAGCSSESSNEQQAQSSPSGGMDEYGLPPCGSSGNAVKVLNAAMKIETHMRPDGDGGLIRTPHPKIRGTIRHVGVDKLGIDMEADFWADGEKLDDFAILMNEDNEHIYYELEGGEQTDFFLETDTPSEPTRFELIIKTLPAQTAEYADVVDWIEGDENGCV